MATLDAEFDRQLANLLHKGYAEAAGMTAEAFRAQLAPLKAALQELTPAERLSDEGRVPFVIVVSSEAVAAADAICRVERQQKQGFSVLEADDLERFQPIQGLEIPDGLAYLLIDVETGKATRNVTPNEALGQLQAAGRSPLTVAEGIALITHYPELVGKNAGFSLLGSRCGDRRVTALWISEGKPKLGWCWAGNPHTWLGSASCSRRLVP